MPEHDARDSDSTTTASGAPATPRVSGELASQLAVETPDPVSSTRAALLPEEASAVSEPGDTLLSAGRPADRLELLIEDRFAALEERFVGLDARLEQVDRRLLVLEQKKSIPAPEARQKPWLWIAFLIALVVVFQMLRLMRSP